ncbi:MAG TPA: hypothetical protein VMM38_15025 [Aridibacter sp.]|nr:hypothetical protein [Aridibacter sp.]
METYDANTTPDPFEWLDLDENERAILVKEYHEDNDIEAPEASAMLHARIHVVVENQLAEEVEGVAEAIERLTREGLDRHEAVHAISALNFSIMNESRKAGESRFTPESYKRRLDDLTIERWLDGTY